MTTVSSGQTFVVSFGETISDATVLGGEIYVSAGGTANATVVSGGTEEVIGNVAGITSNTIVGSGALLRIDSGGTASDTIVSGGGTLMFLPGATLINTTMMSGATYEPAYGRVVSGYVLTGGV